MVIRDDRDEIARGFVLGDDIELTAPEVGEKHRPEVALGDGGDRLGVELLLEDRLEGNFGPFERERGDRGAR